MTVWIFTNGRPSNGAKALAQEDGIKRCVVGKGIKPTDILVNWGSSKPIDLPKGCDTILNDPVRVKLASNKLDFFEYLFGPECPDPFIKTVEWTDSQNLAEQWVGDGYIVVARTKLTGHSGDGIIIVEKGEAIPDAPLYTKYIFKEKEYRVHVANGKVIDTQRKIKDPDREVVTWKVRSHANGFLFARNGIDPDHARDQLATAAVNALGLHFGAVDIIQDKAGVLYVLEINTAPGLEGQTVERYAEAFRSWGQPDGG